MVGAWEVAPLVVVGVQPEGHLQLAEVEADSLRAAVDARALELSVCLEHVRSFRQVVLFERVSACRLHMLPRLQLDDRPSCLHCRTRR